MIPSGAAFFVKTTAAANFTFLENDKSASIPSANLLKMETLKTNAIQLDILSDDTIFWDQFVLRNRSVSKDELDEMDAPKMANPDVNFYSLALPQSQLAIDHRKIVDNSIVNLGFTSSSDYHFTLKVSNLDMPGFDTYLVDNYLNTTTNLSLNTKYYFQTNTDANSKGDSRFQLKFVTNSNGNKELNQKVHFIAYPNPVTDKLQVGFMGNSLNDSEFSFSLFNQIGQELEQGDFSFEKEAILSIDMVKYPRGIYFVSFKNKRVSQTIRFVK